MSESKLPLGVLLTNLGTPKAPTPSAVRPYLRQFLTDPRVIDLPWLPRQLLVRGIIAPFRAKHSAHAYKSIWTKRGSPLLFHSQDLAEDVGANLGSAYKVALGMRYGQPSLVSALDSLVAQGCADIVVLPLYPQESSATTGSTWEELGRALPRYWNVPRLHAISPFFEHPGFVRSVADGLRPMLYDLPDDGHVLFSFHGLPERHIRKTGQASCFGVDCCAVLHSGNARCYKAQCHATARAVALECGLENGQWTISFQSRLGRDPWIGPSTEDCARNLAQAGKRHLVVATPAFVADCLETLEEIGLRLRETFLREGGKHFAVAPCPNASPVWVESVANMIRERIRVLRQEAESTF